MKRFAGVLIASLGFVLAATSPALADPSWTGHGDGDGADVSGQQPVPGSGGGPSTNPVYRVPGPWTDYKYVPACSSNSANEGSADALCMAAVSTCPDDGDIRFWVYTRRMGADDEPIDDNWEHRPGSVCRGADDPPEGGPVQITEAMIFDQAREVAPDTVVHVEPKAKSYVNVPTNFYAENATVTRNITVLGVGLSVQFDPSGFQWTFGDSGTGSGAGIKDARVGAPGAVEYVYRRSGDYNVSLARSFAVTVQLPGGQTLSLTQPVRNASAPYPLEIGEVQAVVTKVS